MSLSKRPPPRTRRVKDGPPTWLIFLVGIAVVFGGYYVCAGVQNFVRTGGSGVLESTERAIEVSTATAESFRPTRSLTLPATFTPIPTCQDFVVTAASAIVRERPDLRGAIITTFRQNQVVCVLERAAPGSEWYLVDTDPDTRRIDPGYMNETIIRAVKPTLTPSRTPSPPPTITATPSPTASQTLPPQPTVTRDPGVTDTPTPTLTPTATPPRQSA